MGRNSQNENFTGLNQFLREQRDCDLKTGHLQKGLSNCLNSVTACGVRIQLSTEQKTCLVVGHQKVKNLVFRRYFGPRKESS